MTLKRTHIDKQEAVRGAVVALSHDLNNAIGVALANVQLVLEQRPEPLLEDMLRDADEALQHAAGIVSGLSLVNRPPLNGPALVDVSALMTGRLKAFGSGKDCVIESRLRALREAAGVQADPLLLSSLLDGMLAHVFNTGHGLAVLRVVGRVLRLPGTHESGNQDAVRGGLVSTPALQISVSAESSGSELPGKLLPPVADAGRSPRQPALAHPRLLACLAVLCGGHLAFARARGLSLARVSVTLPLAQLDSGVTRQLARQRRRVNKN